MNEIRDPIFGFIEPSDSELKIINTPIFQRLRRIKQLALTNLVYPGANHTRFEHSLGVLHLASKMAETLLENEEDRRIVKFAALLHDIGHGPFSHVSEYVLDKYSDFKQENKEKIHEIITEIIIDKSAEFNNSLNNDDRKRIVGLLKGNDKVVTLMSDIVSGPLDADKMDYLLRDSYYCGVKYGIFDHHRMLNTFTSFQDHHINNWYLGIRNDGINALEQFFLAKYFITKQVYRHKVRSVTDAMIIRALELGIEEDNIDFIIKLYKFNGSEEYLENYLNYWDDKLVNEIVFSNKNGYAKNIFSSLMKRNLFKRIFTRKLDEIDVSDFRDALIDIDNNENQKIKMDLEERISKLDSVKCDKNYVIINTISIKNVKEMFGKEETIMVLDKEKKPKIFEDESTIFKSINKEIQEIYVEVYAPFQYDSSIEKTKKLSQLDFEILEILKSMGN